MNFSKKIFVFTIINNKTIFENNTKKCFEKQIVNQSNISFEVTENFNNQYNSIRSWINDILKKIHSSPEIYKDSQIVFIHQDVVIFDDFFTELIKMLHSQSHKIGVWGLAGIDKNGKEYQFMNDSGTFCFTDFFNPQPVHSVDEFLFGLNANAIIKHNIYLSNLDGWHAYAAEFSFLLQEFEYQTFALPIYTEHNSIRTNNNGINQTHNQLYKLYNKELKTLVGTISKKKFSEKLKLKIYNFYVIFFKWKYKNDFMDKMKSFILDDLNLKFNSQRFLHKIINKYTELEYIVVHSDNFLVKNNLNINVNKTQIHFRIVNNLNQDEINTKNNFLILGHNFPIKSFKFLSKIALNIKEID